MMITCLNILLLLVTTQLNNAHPSDYIPSVEEIQDAVEKVLINQGQARMAKSYILYRQKRTEFRKLKQNILGKLDDSKLSVNGLMIAQSRYLNKNKDEHVIETPKEMFKRVAKSCAPKHTPKIGIFFFIQMSINSFSFFIHPVSCLTYAADPVRITLSTFKSFLVNLSGFFIFAFKAVFKSKANLTINP